MGEVCTMPPLFYIYITMRNKIVILAALVLGTMTACNNKKAPTTASDYLRPASMDYTQQDTADIKYLVDTYMGYFNKGDLDACANMLYTFRNDSAIPYTEQQKAGFKKGLSAFHIYGSKLQRIILRSDRNNRVDIALKIMSNGDIEQGKGVTTLSLNPVVIKGKWYLTLMDKDAEGVEDVYANQHSHED